MATGPPVIIVGAGPSGLATSACLARRGVASVVLERDDCVASLWRKRAYDRLHLHLPKQISALPHAPHGAAAPEYLPRDDFVRYLDAYADRFAVQALLRRSVRAAHFVEHPAGGDEHGHWEVEALNLGTGKEEKHAARFLVVAAGEFDEKAIPAVPGLDTFPGKAIHSSEYRSAKGLEGKAVLVVGCGNSGMEIALDLAESGAAASVVVRGEAHLLTRRIMSLSTSLFAYLPLWAIDNLALFMCYLAFGGDTAKHGVPRPALGPFARKLQKNAYPVIDVGTYARSKPARSGSSLPGRG